MAADSTLTIEYDLANGEKIERHYTNAKKLHLIPHLTAGISWWGEGYIDGMMADAWLERFINNDNSETLESFAFSLRDRLRALNFRVRNNRNLRFGTIGFHLAGFIEDNHENLPILYHVHNGESEFYPDIDPYVVNANLDWTPERVRERWRNGHFCGLRNGDFQPYAVLSNYLSDFFRVLRENLQINGEPFQIPFPLDNLDSWADFLRFEINLVGEIYSISNYPPIIGGKIMTLTIDNDGECKYEMK